MAANESKFNKFLPKDSKARAFLMLGLAFFILILLYFYLTSSSAPSDSGASKVATVPKNIENIPGEKLTPEYQSALVRANQENAKAAQIAGQSSVATLVNYNGETPSTSSCANACCACGNVDMNAEIRNLVASGGLTADAADQLLKLQDADASVSDYASTLDRLVKEGKITPEQARKLLEQYQKNQANKLADANAKNMDKYIKSGQLSVEAANDLLGLQKNGVSTSDYASELQRLVAEGKMMLEMAKRLLADYQKLHPAASAVDTLLKQGKISKETATLLGELQSRNAPTAEYAGTLNQLTHQKKIASPDAARLLTDYRAQHPGDYSEAALELAGLVKDGKISADVAKSLLDGQRGNVSPEDYAAQLDRLVKEGKLSPEMRDKLLKDYQQSYADRNQNLEAVKSSALVDNNLPRNLPPPPPPAQTAAAPGGFATLQQRMAQANTTSSSDRFNAQAVFSGQQYQSQLIQQQQQQLRELESAMRTQAQQIYATWNTASSQQNMVAMNELGAGAGADQGGFERGSFAQNAPPIIRAGDLVFAVLDTEVNSDYPEATVMATIVQGKYKGAKLMGKLRTGGNDNEAVLLSFNLMSMPDWPTAAKIDAVAVDPDTARQAMATDVDHHYIERYGMLFISSFLSGYADALKNAGTSQISADGSAVNVTTAPLSPQGRTMVGLGEVGKNMSTEAKKNLSRPPTVIVAAGIGMGVYFTQDVQKPTLNAIVDTTSNSGSKPVTNKQPQQVAVQNSQESKQ